MVELDRSPIYNSSQSDLEKFVVECGLVLKNPNDSDEYERIYERRGAKPGTYLEVYTTFKLNGIMKAYGSDAGRVVLRIEKGQSVRRVKYPRVNRTGDFLERLRDRMREVYKDSANI